MRQLKNINTNKYFEDMQAHKKCAGTLKGLNTKQNMQKQFVSQPLQIKERIRLKHFTQFIVRKTQVVEVMDTEKAQTFHVGKSVC